MDINEIKRLADELGLAVHRKRGPATDWKGICKRLSLSCGQEFANEEQMIRFFYYGDKNMPIGELAKLCEVSGTTLCNKMDELNIPRRKRGGHNRPKISLQHKKFGFETEKDMLDAWREKMSLKQMAAVLKATGIKITYSNLRRRVSDLRKEDKQT